MNEVVEKVARAIARVEVCGCALGKENVLCDDPRLSDEARSKECDCRMAARAAIKTMPDLCENPGPNYTAGLYSRANIEAFVEDCLRDAALKEG